MTNISRRTFLNITATSIALCLTPSNLKASNKKHTWEGVALGANSTMTLYHEDEQYSKEILNLCIKEIKRLESIFSIYDKTSAISKLNKKGYLNNPAKELVEVITFAQEISKQSNGVFDITVQPLWDIHSKYANNSDKLKKKIKDVKNLINYQNIFVSNKNIFFKNKGMQITLNAIAQGYITDKITDLLRQKGFSNVLVNLGEIKAIGSHPQNRDWNIQTPYLKEEYLSINDEAMASSGAYGTKFNKDLHHLFDPKSATSSNKSTAVTVVAKSAILADALATTLAVMNSKERKEFLGNYSDVRVYVL